METFAILITYESDNQKKIITSGKVTKWIREKALRIIKENRLLSNNGKNNGQLYNYQHFNGELATTELELSLQLAIDF